MPTINRGDDYFQAVTYTGNGSTNTITGLRFQPDFVWVKGRSGATDHALYDSVRGTTKDLVSNSTAAETTQTTGLTAFTSDGFTLGALAKMNTNAATYVAWCWKAGTTSSNTSGTITSTVSVNATAGFSVVTYTGNGLSSATVGHGLGVAPKMVIVKTRSGVNNWVVYNANLTSASYYLLLDSTAAQASAPSVWNSTAPTSTVFSIGSASTTNASSSATYVAYCWADVSGYSKAFSYTGNGSTDGSFVYVGFLPRFVMIKRTDTTGDWYMWDTARNTFDVITNTLLANSSAAETSATSIDALSNGFKLRNTTAGFNASGGTYIGMAWATNPFKNSNAF
jgi:hypothetical protein